MRCDTLEENLLTGCCCTGDAVAALLSGREEWHLLREGQTSSGLDEVHELPNVLIDEHDRTWSLTLCERQEQHTQSASFASLGFQEERLGAAVK